jgi:DMSO reductase anchor subunit
LTAAEGRKFGLTVGLAFGLLAAVGWWRGRLPVAAALGTLSALLILGGLIAPAQLGPVYRAWMALAHFISRFTTPVVTGVLYFVVLTPVGLLMRAFGKDPLGVPKGATTLWRERKAEARQGDMRHQF